MSFFKSMIRNACRTSNSTMTQIRRNKEAETTNAAPTGPTQQSRPQSAKPRKNHVPKHKLSEKNQDFVKKHGFGDLPDKQVTRYRHKAAAIMRRVKELQAHGSAPSLVKKAETIIENAGEDPAKRKNLDSLYHVLCDRRLHLTGPKAAKIMDVVAHAPRMRLSSERGRAALSVLLDSKAARSGKLTPANITAIVNVAADSHVTAARLKTAVPAMADYLAKSKESHAALLVSSVTLTRMPGTARLKTDPDPKSLLAKDAGLLEKNLGAILQSDSPSQTGARLAEKVTAAATTRASQVKKRCIQEYDAALQQAGMSPMYSTEFAQALYDVGGPSSPQGRRLLAVLGRNKIPAAVNNDPLANPNYQWADDMAKKMNHATGNFQPAKWKQLNISGLLRRGPGKAPERGWLTKAADFVGDALSVTSQAADTAQTIVEVAGHVGLPAANAVFSVAASVVGGVFTLSQIGYAYRKFDAAEKHMFSSKGAWKAVETMAAAYHDGKLSEPLAPERARIVYSGERAKAWRDAGRKAFDSAFLKTYKKLLSMPRRATAAYCKALTIARSYDWSLYYDESSFRYQGPWHPPKSPASHH